MVPFLTFYTLMLHNISHDWHVFSEKGKECNIEEYKEGSKFGVRCIEFCYIGKLMKNSNLCF